MGATAAACPGARLERDLIRCIAAAATTSDAKFSKVGAGLRCRDHYALKYKSQPCTRLSPLAFTFHLVRTRPDQPGTCFDEMSPRVSCWLGDTIVPRGRRSSQNRQRHLSVTQLQRLIIASVTRRRDQCRRMYTCRDIQLNQSPSALSSSLTSKKISAIDHSVTGPRLWNNPPLHLCDSEPTFLEFRLLLKMQPGLD